MKKYVLLLALSTAVLAACATMNRPTATAALDAMGTSTARGTVTFVQLADGVEVTVDATGVPPGVHGFHVHEKGDCGNDGGAAGMHFNPAATAHGAPNVDPHHAGDFGNVTADSNGVVHAQFTMRGITVEPGPNSVVDKGVILHAAPDDLTTQPTGNAGARIACGVVQRK